MIIIYLLFYFFIFYLLFVPMGIRRTSIKLQIPALSCDDITGSSVWWYKFISGSVERSFLSRAEKMAVQISKKRKVSAYFSPFCAKTSAVTQNEGTWGSFQTSGLLCGAFSVCVSPIKRGLLRILRGSMLRIYGR